MSTTPAASAVVSQSNVAAPVMRSLYRQLLTEAQKIDRAPVAKVMFPLPKKLSTALSLKNQLYVPNSQSYSQVVRNTFRGFAAAAPAGSASVAEAKSKSVATTESDAAKEESTGDDNVAPATESTTTTTTTAVPKAAQFDLNLAFDTLHRLKKHSSVMSEAMPKITKESSKLTKAFELVEMHLPENKHLYVAHPIDAKAKAEASLAAARGRQIKKKRRIGGVEVVPPTADTASAPKGNSPEDILRELASKTSPQPQRLSADIMLDLPASVESIFTSAGSGLVRHDPTAFIKPGLALIAHPLSSAHVDRRVMLITEKTAQVTTGLVLDMAYNYPLSYGNPMFPEVMWGHEVMNGGYCHVDFTMPPTANVSVLHTLPPPHKQHESQFEKWFAWAKDMKVDTDHPEKHHDLLCKPLIMGDPANKIPTLYYSKVESLPYLASLCPGEPKDSLRVYWGCMKWNTAQLGVEIDSGHWIPTELSPSFFSAYAVRSTISADRGRRRSPFVKRGVRNMGSPWPAKKQEAAAKEGEKEPTTHEVSVEETTSTEKKSGETIPTDKEALTEVSTNTEIKRDIPLEGVKKGEASAAEEVKKDAPVAYSDAAAATPAVASPLTATPSMGDRKKPAEQQQAEDDLASALTVPWEKDSPLRGERFPTVDELQRAKAKREKLLGVDVAQPQVFPPDQPLCRREALWDQILYSMGGEYKELVGCANPFSQTDRGSPGPHGGPQALPNDMVMRLLAEMQTRDKGDDDDDDD